MVRTLVIYVSRGDFLAHSRRTCPNGAAPQQTHEQSPQPSLSRVIVAHLRRVETLQKVRGQLQLSPMKRSWLSGKAIPASCVILEAISVEPIPELTNN